MSTLPPPLPQTTVRAAAHTLLERWSEAMLRLQVPVGADAVLTGGILCPCCARIHGRCGDAVHPLLHLARSSGQARWLDAAIALGDWHRLVDRPDGAVANETVGNEWLGTTVFSATALGEALLHHADLLPAALRTRWQERLAAMADWLAVNIDGDFGNVNYPLSVPVALALASRALGETRWLGRAAEMAALVPRFLTADDLIHGEGPRVPTPRGHASIDIGYDVEESLPYLAHYADLVGDGALAATVRRSLLAHMPFALPDGGWDEGWCSRAYKWTWWGSRTSDGVLPLLLRHADHPAVAAMAAAQLRQLVFCTSANGLLHGGPHHIAWGAPACVHLTFSHARGLASALELPADLDAPADAPWPARGGTHVTAAMGAVRIDRGPWAMSLVATDRTYDDQFNATLRSGISLLWHERIGALLFGGPVGWHNLEPSNLEPLRSHQERRTMVARIERQDGDGACWRSCDDLQSTLTHDAAGGMVEGSLAKRDRPNGPSCRLSCRIDDEAAVVTAEGPADAQVILPVVAAPGAVIDVLADGVTLRGPGGWHARSARPITLGDRIFHSVPGLVAQELRLALDAGPVSVAFTPG